jgi:long-chain acyl-CoA synthetase
VPIKICGTDRVLPHEVTFPKQGTVAVTFGEPLRFRFEEPAVIVERVRQAVEKL